MSVGFFYARGRVDSLGGASRKGEFSYVDIAGYAVAVDTDNMLEAAVLVKPIG